MAKVTFKIREQQKIGNRQRIVVEVSTDDDNINIFAGFPSTITKTFGINTPVSTIEQEFMTVIQSVISSANIKIIENNLIGKEFTFNT